MSWTLAGLLKPREGTWNASVGRIGRVVMFGCLAATVALAGLLGSGPLPRAAAATPVGGGWSAPTNIDYTSFYSVSCPSPSFCMAVDDSGNALIWNGSSWSNPKNIDRDNILYSVSCPSPSFCMAVDDSGYVLNWDGNTWSSPKSIDGTNGLTSVSCPSTTFCMAVDVSGNALIWNGGSTWTSYTGIDSSSNHIITSVSCPSPSFCMAVDDSGYVLNWDGNSWSSGTHIDGTNFLFSVSCPSPSFCMAVDDSGNAFSWDGSSWSSAKSIDIGNGLTSVSCPSTTFCMAVDVSGNALSWVLSTAPTITSISPFSGTTIGGTQVTITGTNLSGATAVDFGSNKATSFTVNSSTLITATSPPGSAGDVAVTVTTPEGTSSNTLSCGDIFTYGATSQAAQSGSYNPISPFRLADTRPGSGEPYAGKTLSACGTLDIQAIGVSGSSVPVTGVAGVIVNVTAVDPGGSGYLTVYPAGSVRPEASNLNFESGKTVANLVDVGVSQAGEIAIYNGSAYPTNVVVDIAGYYSSTGQLYTPISPLRVCDTRQGNPSKLSGLQAQCNGHSLVANVPLTVDLTGTGLLPQGAQAAVVNLTVINPTGGGYLTAYPASLATAPTASNLNFQKGELISNRATVTLPSTGQIDIVSNTSTNVVVDVGGYYSTTGSSYTPLGPTRIADSRCTASPPPSFCAAEQIPSQNAGFSALGPGSTSTLTVAGIAGVPLTATAVVLNMTVAATTAGSFLTVWPGGKMPTASDLNWSAGTTIPNLVVVEVNSGKISLYNNAGSVQVICDVEGWYG